MSDTINIKTQIKFLFHNTIMTLKRSKHKFVLLAFLLFTAYVKEIYLQCLFCVLLRICLVFVLILVFSRATCVT